MILLQRPRLVAPTAVIVLTIGLVLPAAAGGPGDTTAVSVGTDGAFGDERSMYPSMSGDGRRIAFISLAENLGAVTPNGDWDVFLRDVAGGTTEQVSVAPDGAPGNGLSAAPAISADGRVVAFHSAATNLVDGDTNLRRDIFVRDVDTGVTKRVSLSSAGFQANNHSAVPAISADGRYVAFHSSASNLVEGDSNGVDDVFVHDRRSGETERISVASDGTQGDGHSRYASVSVDGRFVAFDSEAGNLAPGGNSDAAQVYVHDRETGVTERVSVASDGTPGDSRAHSASVNADGRLVAFTSAATNLVPGTENEVEDVYVHDREPGVAERVSVASDGVEGNGDSGFADLSPDGRFVAFHSGATNLVSDDTNNVRDVFVHDRVTGVTERVSLTGDGDEANGTSLFPALSDGAGLVAFQSNATNLLPGGSSTQIYVRARGPALGIGRLEAVSQPDGIAVQGWARFGGAVISAATSGPGPHPLAPLGAEIAAASVTARPEPADLLVRWVVPDLPDEPVPGLVYGLSLEADGTSFEVRAQRVALEALPDVSPVFTLHRCDPDCEEVADLSGGIGTTGGEARVALPLAALDLAAPAALTGLRAFSALGDARLGMIQEVHAVSLPDAAVPTTTVQVGLGTPDEPPDSIAFTDIGVDGGRFQAVIERDGLAAGEHHVWARACRGEDCEAQSVAVASP